MSILLVAAGGLFALLFIFITITRAVQGREKVSFFETLLAFLALTLPLLALVNNNASDPSLMLVNRAPIGIAALVIVASFVTSLIEWRKSARAFNQRRGVLGIGIGVLLIAATFAVPLVSRLDLFAPMTNPQAVGNAPTASDNLVNISETGRGSQPESVQQIPLMATNTPGAIALEVSATPTRLPSITPTPTNTPYMLVSPTPGTAVTTQNESQPVVITERTCLAVVQNNLNLRSGPGMDQQLLLTIPSSTTLDLSGRNQDSSWWFVQYQAQAGWVNGDYLTLGPGCEDLPLRAG